MLIYTITAEDYFYPRSPCGERQSKHKKKPLQDFNFYPRSPCGERRYRPTPKPVISWHFYPRSPCGERPIISKPLR